MKNYSLKPSNLVIACAALLATGCATTAGSQVVSAVQNQTEQETVTSVTIDLPPQALFTFIGFDYKSSAAESEEREIFQSRALPMAAEYGFARHGALILNGTGVGSFQPQGFLLASWPSQAAFDNFQADPRWPEFDALRPEIWNDIRYYRDVQEDGLQLTFRSDKFYTLAIAHINQDNPDDYQTYLSSLGGEVARNGGEFIFIMRDPSLESLSNAAAPDQLTLIEWDDVNGLDRLLASDVYAANRHLAASGTTDFAFYRLRPAL